ncbi:hypothetical protein IKD57_00425 [Candidatus Saccharibacteria bacterium]|nr:hypothetical protein [Candidatus Saccharibacteria bacterium]MBR2658351.1 hypothetical protein [Candidatus Saccharibacteria bacterium]
MFNRIMLLLSLVAVIIILVMMNFTTPTSVGPLGVLVFLVTVYLVIFGVVNLAVTLILKAAGRERSMIRGRYYAATISFGPIMLLLVQSFGSLNILTVFGVAVVIMLGCFVISKRL